MNGKLDELSAFILKHYPFTESRFPALKNASEDEIQQFAIRHLALHFAKTAGKMVGAIEPTDHGDAINIEEIRANLPKALVNTLRLALLVGVSEKELVAGVERVYNDTFSPKQ